VYIPQYGRFLIYEDYGCTAFISNTPVGIALGCGPQVLVSFACAVYSSSFIQYSSKFSRPESCFIFPALTVRTLYKKYSELNKLLASNNTLDRGRYLRVLVIALLGSVCLVPLGLYSLIRSCNNVSPWPGWKAVHADMSQIVQIPASVWRSDHIAQYDLEISRWEFFFNSVMLFACFGIHKEARTRYVSWVRSIFRCAPSFRVKKCYLVLLTVHEEYADVVF
jgi:pheromone a factor receptor